jgi:hypothetical protein
MDRQKMRLAIICLAAALCMLVELVFIHNTRLPEYFLLAYSPPPTLVKRLPSCLVIGVRKGGTRALLDSMALHPQVRAARRELHFFDRNITYQLLGEAWYREQIPPSLPSQVVIEKSPSYFTNPLVPGRVKSFNRMMKMM